MDKWFSLSSKPDNVKPAGTERRNNTSPSAQVDDIVKPPSKYPPPVSKYSSPHDAVLAQMRGLPVDSGTDAKNHPESLPIHADHHPQAADSVGAPSPSSVSFSTANNPAGPREVLHDPFDGSPLGLLVADSQRQQLQQRPGSVPGNVRVSEGGPKEEELWVHLSRVLELQNQVAKMHLEMEAVGPNDGKSKAAGRGHARRKGKEEVGSGDHTDNLAEGVDKVIGVEDAPEGDDEGVGVEGDEEAESKRAREAEFAGLADHFEGRNESINTIMGRLDLLSKALTEFHALQAPTVEFPRSSSRQNTTTPGTTPSTIHGTPSSVIPPSLPIAGTTTLPNSNLLRPSLPSSGGSLSGALHSFPRDSILPVSLSRTVPRSNKAKNPVSPLIVNAIEPDKQTHMMDSPASMGKPDRDLKLPSEQGATSTSEH